MIKISSSAMLSAHEDIGMTAWDELIILLPSTQPDVTSNSTTTTSDRGPRPNATVQGMGARTHHLASVNQQSHQEHREDQGKSAAESKAPLPSFKLASRHGLDSPASSSLSTLVWQQPLPSSSSLLTSASNLLDVDPPAQPATPPSLPPPRPLADTIFSYQPPNLLPPQRGPKRKTLVLDLDQTLIECLHLGCSCSSEPDFVYEDSQGCRAKVWKRPSLMQFLETVKEVFEVVLFTAAAPRHADAVLQHIDPSGSLFEHRLYGHHTVSAPQWGWVKDLAMLGRDLSQTLIVDDCPQAALFQPANWVSISPFSQSEPGWRSDTGLLDILAFLKNKVLPAADVRQAISKYYCQVSCRPISYSAAAKLSMAHQSDNFHQRNDFHQSKNFHQSDTSRTQQLDQWQPVEGAMGTPLDEDEDADVNVPLRRVRKVHAELSAVNAPVLAPCG